MFEHDFLVGNENKPVKRLWVLGQYILAAVVGMSLGLALYQIGVFT